MKKSKNDTNSGQESLPILNDEEQMIVDLISKIIVDTTLRELQELKSERKKAEQSGNTE